MALKVLGGINDIGICMLSSQDVVRHPLVQKIVKAYDDYEAKQKHLSKDGLKKDEQPGQNKAIISTQKDKRTRR